MAITRDIAAVISPMTSELRTAKVSHQKISFPRESVPKKCSGDGGTSMGTSNDLFGSYGETKESRIITRTANSKIKAMRKRPSYCKRSRSTLNIGLDSY